MSTTTEPKGAAGADLPDGLHAAAGVEYLARLEGFEGDRLPRAVVLQRGFSETTMFILSSKGDGYYQTSLGGGCTCPDFRFRKAGTGQLCKHQRQLAALLQDRGTASPALPRGVAKMTSEALEARAGRIAARNARQAEEREARATMVSPSRRGFNLPEEVEA